MAQSGFHGIIGLYGSRALAGSGAASAREKGDLKFGFVLGNIVPDVDLLPLVLLYLYDSRLAMSMHRTFTHSLLMAAAVYFVFAARRRPGLALGLAAGMVLHDLVDVAVWFSGVDLLWPLGLLGLPSTVNLWANLHIPGVVGSLLGAADYLAYGIYFVVLRRAALRQETCLSFLPRLRLYTGLQWVLTAIFVVLALMLSHSLFNVLHYALFTLVMLPLAIYITVKMRPVIEVI
ncbi:MAG: metal-dependent hydrolase [Bacillota bacterium]|nr:metal-dependent hydrolase [Bacillota bacterium]